MEGNGQRFVATVDPSVRGELKFRFDQLEADGASSNLMGVPATADELPAVGMSTSQFPGVVFGIFPNGSRDIAAHTPGDRYHYPVSTMLVATPLPVRTTSLRRSRNL
jgi:hypothetical protein